MTHDPIVIVSAVRTPLGRFQVSLPGEPARCPFVDCDPAAVGINVGAGLDRRRYRVQPVLGVNLAVEVASVLSAVVSVARSPFTVRTLGDVGHKFALQGLGRRRASGRLPSALLIDPSADVGQAVADVSSDLETVRALPDVSPPAHGGHRFTDQVGDFGDGEQAVVVVRGRVLSFGVVG